MKTTILLVCLFVVPLSGWGAGKYVVNDKERARTLEIAKAIFYPEVTQQVQMNKIANPFMSKRPPVKR